MSGTFDRVRPRSASGPPDGSGPLAAGPSPDVHGKQVLFTSPIDVTPPGVGSVRVECSRCEQQTVLGLVEALRVALPSLHLGLRVSRGDVVRSATFRGRDYPTYLKCPACGRPSWVRFTVQL
jgi:hypothetical protein